MTSLAVSTIIKINLFLKKRLCILIVGSTSKTHISVTFHQHGCLVCNNPSDPLASNTCFAIAFFFFLYFPLVTYLSLCKAFNKKKIRRKTTTRSFPTVFFLLSLPVSVGHITTSCSQLPLSSA